MSKRSNEYEIKVVDEPAPAAEVAETNEPAAKRAVCDCTFCIAFRNEAPTVEHMFFRWNRATFSWEPVSVNFTKDSPDLPYLYINIDMKLRPKWGAADILTRCCVMRRALEVSCRTYARLLVFYTNLKKACEEKLPVARHGNAPASLAAVYEAGAALGELGFERFGEFAQLFEKARDIYDDLLKMNAENFDIARVRTAMAHLRQLRRSGFHLENMPSNYHGALACYRIATANFAREMRAPDFPEVNKITKAFDNAVYDALSFVFVELGIAPGQIDSVPLHFL